MTRFKIKSNPYIGKIEYFVFKEGTNEWVDATDDSQNSRLLEMDDKKFFFPFKAKEILDIIIEEYGSENEKIELVFEGTADEYEELETICKTEDIKDKIKLIYGPERLKTARDILEPTKAIFTDAESVITDVLTRRGGGDVVNNGDLRKVKDALDDIIPICMVGNYSAGKSTFINALIGNEVLPSGGDPVTAKVFKIKRSKAEDRAYIRFIYNGMHYNIKFDAKDWESLDGDRASDIIRAIDKEIQENAGDREERDLVKMVNITVKTINDFEKNSNLQNVINNIIEIDVPFSNEGKLGRSNNNFVIIDTPGPNSATHQEHAEVLQEALDGLSNGIPVLVTQYESIDSEDNAKVCKEIYNIEALDNRFAMIVVNKADSAELPSFKEFKEKEDSFEEMVKEYTAIKDMYSGGIYFVSSIMGLGSKNDSENLSDYICEVYEEKENKFSNPKSRFYRQLYMYNVMPEQIKDRVVEYSTECDNLIYANSGLYCIENEMERFASKYAAYNKVQMVYVFLDKVHEKIKNNIEASMTSKESLREKTEKELDEKKIRLINKIKNKTENLNYDYTRNSSKQIKEYIRENLEYFGDAGKLQELWNDVYKQKVEELKYNELKKKIEEAEEEIRSPLVDFLIKDLFNSDDGGDEKRAEKTEMTEGVSEVVDEDIDEDIGADGAKDTDKDADTNSSTDTDNVGEEALRQEKLERKKEKEIEKIKQKIEKEKDKLERKQKKEEIKQWEYELDKLKDRIEEETSDIVISNVNESFRENNRDAEQKIGKESKEYWLKKTEEYKAEMIKIIKATEDLSTEEGDKLYKIISEYQAPQFEDNGVDLFIKSQYLKTRFFGLLKSEIINTKRLNAGYNREMDQSIENNANRINSEYNNCYKAWQSELLDLIEENITEYNPELKKVCGEISELTADINKLERDNMTITNAFKKMEELKEWDEEKGI